MNMTKIICTIGPASRKKEILSELEKKVDFFRINLSHTPHEDVERVVKTLTNYKVPVIIDTEGRQVRTTNHEDLNFDYGSEVKIFNHRVENIQERYT